MKLTNLLRKDCIVANADVQDKNDVLCQIARTAKQSGVLADVSESEILQGLKEREKLGSTGFGNGIAIPHCRLKSVSKFVVGIITVPAGVDFEAVDKEPVKLLVFIIAPDCESNAHVKLLSAISRALLGKGRVDEIVSQQNPEKISQVFLAKSTEDIETNGKQDKKILHVIIQDEDIYHQIVQALATTVTSSLVVVDAENARSYMARIPLFAGLWGNNTSRFSKVVVAIIESGLVNEAIRSVETVTGELNKNPGTMLIVQDIALTAGSLETGY